MPKLFIASPQSVAKFTQSVGKPKLTNLGLDTPDVGTIATAKFKSERSKLEKPEDRAAFDAQHGVTKVSRHVTRGMTSNAFKKLGGKDIPAVGLPKKSDEWTGDARPDVPELTSQGRKAGTVYREKPKGKKITDRTTHVCSDCGGAISKHKQGPRGLIHTSNAHQIKIGGRGDTHSVSSHADERGPRTPSQSPQFLSHAARSGRGISVTNANIEHPKKEESIMNTDKVVDNIIREAFTSGDRNNTTPPSNGMSDKGGTARRMLAGEWFGSHAWAFDQSTSSDFEGSAKLQDTQSKEGMGELTHKAPSYAESVSLAKEIVDNLLEDCPGAEYTNPDSIGYMIEALKDAGYAEYAKTCDEICETSKGTPDTIKVMVEKLTADKAEPFLIEQLTKFAGLLVENETGTPSEKADTEEDPTESPDTGLEA